MIRPSSLPMLSQCPQFQGKGSDFAEAGTKRHKALSTFLGGDTEALAELPEDERDGVEWAAEYIRLKAPASDYPLEFERKRSFLTPGFDRIEGTPDVTCGPHIFDLKWRPRDYWAQMACYALMVLESGFESVTVHVLFAERGRVEVRVFDANWAWVDIESVMDRVTPDAAAVPCDYCGWCAKAETCPALVSRVNAVASGREDWALTKYHPSEIESAPEMGKALALARAIAHWSESVEHHAKEMAIKRGMVPTGFKLQDRKGNRFIASVGDAFSLAGLPQEEFLKACECKPTKLFETYAAVHGIKKTAAEKAVETKLGETIQRKSATVSLVAEKPTKKESETNV